MYEQSSIFEGDSNNVPRKWFWVSWGLKDVQLVPNQWKSENQRHLLNLWLKCLFLQESLHTELFLIRFSLLQHVKLLANSERTHSALRPHTHKHRHSVTSLVQATGSFSFLCVWKHERKTFTFNTLSLHLPANYCVQNKSEKKTRENTWERGIWKHSLTCMSNFWPDRI